MPSANIQAIFQGILIATDNSQSPAPYLVNLDLQNPTLTGLKYYFDSFFQVPNGAPINVPIGGGGGAESFFLLIINRSTTNSLQINVTPTGLSSQEVGTFGPGGVCVLMDPTETGLGWSALTLTGLGAIVPATIFSAI